MITQINQADKNSVAAYKTRFIEANEYLAEHSEAFDINNPETHVETLNDYFWYMEDFRNADDKNAAKFLRMPVDEEMFIIDANSRYIKVGDNFGKNGISVQGDKVSEVIYFMIDRYFDTMDLGRDDIEIGIQWEHMTAKDAGGNKITGLTKAFGVDKESVVDKVIFGWPIGEEITEYAGKIKFAARFYIVNDQGQLTYSLSTLPQTATIQSTIDMEVETLKATDHSELIKQRIKKSESDSTEGTIPGEPVWIYDLTNLVANDGINDGIIARENAEGVVEYFVDLDREGAGTYTFSAQAQPPDGGRISYSWFYHGLDNENWSEMGTNEVVESFKRTTDTVFDVDHVYYVIAVENGVESHVVYGAENWSDGEPIPEDLELYERFSDYVATKAGVYKAVAKNNINKRSTEKESVEVIIPGAKTPVVIPGEFNIDNISYQTIHQLLDESNTCSLMLDSVHGEDDERGTKGISYIWYQLNNETLKPEAQVATTANYVITSDDINYNSYFQVEVTNTRNGVPKKALSAKYRVSAPPKDVKLADRSTGGFVTPLEDAEYSLSAATGIVLALDHYNNWQSDKVYCTWYELPTGVEVPNPATDTVYQARTEMIDGAIATLVTNSYLGHKLYAILENEWNKHISSVYSPIYTITV